AILTKVLPYVDFFVPSIEELCYMLDRGRYDEWMERAAGKDVTLILDINKDIKPLADELLSLGAKVLLIKCGAPGMYFKTAGASALEKIGKKLALNTAKWADKEIFEKSYKPSKVLSGTGAGDTSIAAFLTAILSGRKPQDALRLAAATGTCCVEAYDSLSGLLSFAELEEKIAAGWEKQEF
ncbi:MAG: carbohydrate kinase family protein, partial [Lachnospiraceae bacterium]|nr:carbohydrate kinase family protein [Lachnospiraceae bacterium]